MNDWRRSAWMSWVLVAVIVVCPILGFLIPMGVEHPGAAAYGLGLGGFVGGIVWARESNARG
ncbi:MAG: hypothetical protein ACP5QO_13460 [Clostridia bacterium]